MTILEDDHCVTTWRLSGDSKSRQIPDGPFFGDSGKTNAYMAYDVSLVSSLSILTLDSVAVTERYLNCAGSEAS